MVHAGQSPSSIKRKIKEIRLTITTEKRALQGGADKALLALRESGRLLYSELVRIAYEDINDIYRARATIKELERRGAFVRDGEYAVDEFCNDYRICLDSLTDRIQNSSDIAERNGWNARYATAILEDLARTGFATKHPTFRGRHGWTVAMTGVDPEVQAGPTERYSDQIVALVSVESKTSREISEVIGLSYMSTLGILRTMKAEGLVNNRMSVKDAGYWYSTQEAYKDACSKTDVERDRSSIYDKPFSKGEPLNGRNPDFASKKDLGAYICELLGASGPLSEAEIKSSLGRTRPIKKLLRTMWGEGVVTMVMDRGEWRYALPEPSED